MSEIPMDAKIAIQGFLAQQRSEELKRMEIRQAQALSKPVTAIAKKPMTAKQVQKVAKENGLEVVNGKGRHGVHIVSLTGAECPLPVHGRGRMLAVGTQQSIMKFIINNSVGRS